MRMHTVLAHREQPENIESGEKPKKNERKSGTMSPFARFDCGNGMRSICGSCE
jgi:hypothetical protein